MKRLLKILKIIAVALIGVVLLFAITTISFLNMNPQFGDAPTAGQQKTFAAASNFHDGKFENQIPTSMSMSFSQTMSVMGEFFFGKKNGKEPGMELPMEKVDSITLADRNNDVSGLIWFGHSANLLELDGRKILIDPMLGQRAGPLPILSPKRYNRQLPIEVEKLPFIDVVIISHDHYDHLDYGSIRKLKDNVGRFYVPLGVGGHLRSWGVNPNIITELNWWEEVKDDGITFICTPARHFSGRGFTRNETLWSSWVIRSSRQQIYFSGDSGYGPHFKQIGEEYGAMDFVMMECGQYNDLWSAIHMTPEETVQATLDVKGRVLMPIHWGAFTLAMHAWTDPIERVTREAKRLNVAITTPKIGEMLFLDKENKPAVAWWQ
jgi:L-ascorbate metabolism protein UlaG (beta-lactamase superfamily)